MADRDKSLQSLVNASGFVLQLAVEAAVEEARDSHGWTVYAREYPWTTGTREGFVDIILKREKYHLVVECKRRRDADWVFLMPDDGQRRRTHARVRWTNTAPNRPPLSVWGDIQIDPGSPESEFCIVRGQGEKDRPMLERMAAELLESVEAVSADLLILDEQNAFTRVVVPVILTTARLHLCRFDVGAVELAKGDVDDGDFIEVPSVRFRKSLAGTSVPLDYEPEALTNLSGSSERTVFVVNSTHFIEWLRDFDTREVSGAMAWDFARERANAMGG